MAKGVHFMHKRGICHLDLSLENMLLTTEDEIRICDFGQAQEKRYFESFSPRRGKLGYMCPEMYKYHPFDGYKADVWSLGVIFWSMLANGSLYDKPIPSDPHFAYVARGSEGLKRLFEGSGVSDIPASTLELLAGMLSIYPSSRYTIEQVLQHPWLQEPKKSMKQENENVLQQPVESVEGRPESVAAPRKTMQISTEDPESGSSSNSASPCEIKTFSFRTHHVPKNMSQVSLTESLSQVSISSEDCYSNDHRLLSTNLSPMDLKTFGFHIPSPASRSSTSEGPSSTSTSGFSTPENLEHVITNPLARSQTCSELSLKKLTKCTSDVTTIREKDLRKQQFNV